MEKVLMVLHNFLKKSVYGNSGRMTIDGLHTLPLHIEQNGEDYFINNGYENDNLTFEEYLKELKRPMNELVKDGIYYKIEKNKISSIKEAIDLYHKNSETCIKENRDSTCYSSKKINFHQKIQNEIDARDYLMSLEKNELVDYILN